MHLIKKYGRFVLAIALLGEIYFSYFSIHLRFSAGIIALSVIILISDEISELKLSFLSAIAVFVLRTILGILFSSFKIKEIILLNMPSAIYYLSFGFLAFITNVKREKDNLFKTVIILSLVDSISNVIEITIRGNLSSNIIRLIFLVGILRSLIAYYIYSFYKKQELFILNREHQKRYSQLNSLVSNIQAEMFYLKKSMKDIENVMAKSYDLYEKYKSDNRLNEKLLDISREVHEIKKDYYRVLKGFENFIKKLEKEDEMKLSDIFNIIKENTERFLAENNKKIKLTFRHDENFSLKNYCNLFTILNNLIINSIDACCDGDKIKVIALSEADKIVFKVIDTGEGIEEDIIPYIFNPGFTTKYNDKTGVSSTGIGLSHVKNIVEDFKGNIEIESIVNEGTKFKITIPKNSLIG
ncbi:sensor histidine kinase [Caminicella sporogenes]|uniref:sensor histidine kinase n=1 Tax=Caminicella sporogenes TaxID=166485 RepID=UPI002540BB3F|nr:sensor histidine kinase [Caminicella sporogenes]WIF94172.1 sensor histidine kinase [Caminicella sporogenes]